MNSIVYDFMTQYFEEVKPKDFYRAVFPEGELAQAGKQETGKYTAIAVELLPKVKNQKQKVNRYTVTDDLNKFDELLESKNFIIISPFSYAGKSRKSENARFMYGLAIDFDGISKKTQITDLFHQMQNVDFLPLPTYCVLSGNGLHLYYLFERPIPCFKNVTKQIADLKTALTKKMWNKYTTDLYEQVQIESLFQGFRMAGGVSKQGERTVIFETGCRTTIEKLNEYVEEEHRVKEFTYKSSLTLARAKEQYPEWYENRIEKKKPKGTWTTKTDLYYWWIRKLKAGASVGHRYFCIMCLAIYAKKAGISREQLEEDAFGLVEYLDCLTTDEENHFTNEDVLQALEMYNDSYYTFPIDTITELTQIHIEKNKRNGRKQVVHLAGARVIQEVNDKYNNTNWREGNGRKPKSDIVEQWQKNHPEGKKADCIRETGLDKKTVYKYWK